MKRRRVSVILLACVVAGTVIAIVWPREREPRYQGKTLTQLLVIWRKGFGREGGADGGEKRLSEQKAAREAGEGLTQIGTNALPWVLKWIGDEETPWEGKVMGIILRLPGPLSRPLYHHFEETLVRAAQTRRSEVTFFYLMLLGSKASPAVPELTQWLNDPKSSEFRKNVAIRALSCIGKEGLPPLLDALNEKPPRNFQAAATHICEMTRLGTNAAPAVPTVVGLLGGPDGTIAGSAAHVLGWWRIEPGLVVPALMESAQEPKKNIFLRFNSIESLGKFGERARPAVPVLVESLTDVDGNIRQAATNALRNVAPEVLERPGARREGGLKEEK